MIAQTLDVLLRGQTKDFQKKFQQAGKTFGTFRNQVTSGGARLQSSMVSTFGGIASAAAMYLGPISAGAFLGWGVKLAGDAEAAQVGFSNLLQSGEKAKLLLSQLTEFSSSTPFQLGDIRKSAQSLLAFGVDAGQVMNQMKLLGDVSAGAGANLSEVTQIAGKAFAKQKIELETLNQLAERQIPIFTTLAESQGVSVKELSKMVSAGKIGFPELQAALENMTGATGPFNDAMNKNSKTILGLWSTTVDNVALVAQDIGQVLIEVFDFKGLLDAFISASQWIREQLESWKPAFFAVKDIAVAVFNQIAEAVSALVSFVKPAFQPLIDLFTSTFGSTMASFQEVVLSALYAIQFGVENLPRVWQLAVTKTSLAIVGLYEDVKHFFITLIPTVFTSFGSGTISFFTNLASNIGSAMVEIWDYITSGGTDSIDIVWAPLTEGFQKAIEETKQAASRGLTDVEEILMQDVASQQDSLMQDMGAFINTKMEALKEVAEETQVTLEGQATTTGEQEATTGKSKKDLAAVTKGSVAAASVINQSRQDPQLKAVEKQNKLTEDTNKKLQTLIDNTSNGALAAAAL